MSTTDQNHTARIRALNDQFRVHGEGRGSIALTSGIQALGELSVIKILIAVRDFEAFDADNDPWNEHDFGALDVEGQRVFFKIDYYDRSITTGSPDPADPEVTHRALTIMLADEY
ncbi:DUF3768 domain-containing protein [Henriciella sp.]|uniref:DUF3768 domain-containing protein n=1 Tax=Henriciella sp. TaxID=1968823 RepID=UPI00261BF85D|nr:DUF3768 domain-containing protein [Henriciella sp.]